MLALIFFVDFGVETQNEQTMPGHIKRQKVLRRIDYNGMQWKQHTDVATGINSVEVMLV